MDDTQDSAAGASVPVGAVIGLLAVFPDGSEEQFSGALISPDEVLTAAHGVYKQGVGQASEVIALAGGVPVDLSVAGSEPVFQSGTYAASVHANPVPDAGGALSVDGTQDDEALLGFGTPLSAGPVFALDPGVASATVTIAGFPADGSGQELAATGTITQAPGTTAYVGETGLGAGSSGGPIFMDAGGEAELVGTVSTTAYATQLSAALLAQVEAWQAADAFTPLGAASATAAGSAGLYDFEGGTLVSQGADTVQAGGGDAIVYAAGASASILGGTGDLTVIGGAGSDTVRPGSGRSVLYGGSGGGVFEASSGGDSTLVAGAGNTTLVGGGAGDTLFCAPTQAGCAAAGPGAETIVAGQGATTILGGTGTATVFAGLGADTFQLWDGLGGTLQIVGYTAQDVLQVSTADPVVAKSSGSWGTILGFADGSQAVLFGVPGDLLPGVG